MLSLGFAKPENSPYKILCLGSHCDDIEIGCGGTILKLLRNNRNTAFYWVVLSSDERRAKEARESANTFLQSARHKNIIIESFRDGFLPFLGGEIKRYFEQLKKEFMPDVVFTHHRGDLHQDHRFISDLTWNTFRDHLILEYEIPKYDGDLGSPNFFVHLTQEICKKKIQYILESFESQKQRQWLEDEIFLSILRIRGMESNSPSKYAEAFYCRKIVLESKTNCWQDNGH